MNETPILNGNRFVKTEHVFIYGKGCYFPTLEIDQKEGRNPNNAGYRQESIEFNGKTWFLRGVGIGSSQNDV